MPNPNTTDIREKILSILRRRGPLLPVHIANDTGLSMLFASAFLSELLSEKRIRISSMKVGSSPVYFLPGHEFQLERYSSHLKSREKDAFLLLKERRILKDSKQEPAIRVALRSIRDFAMPFKKDNEIFWRYFTVSENEVREKLEPKAQEKIPEKEIKQEIVVPEREIKEEISIPEKVHTKTEEVKKTPRKPAIKRKSVQKKTNQKNNEKFFNQVKEFLSKEPIEIINIEGFGKSEILLRIKEGKEEKLLIAYNKKKISESEIIQANKKASELNLKYVILSMGEPSKKLANLIESVKNLEKIEKM